MDESENTPHRETPGAAKDAADFLKADAEKTLGDIKSRGIRGFLSFEHMYFPSIANYVFIVIVLLSVIGMIVGVLAGFAAIFTTGVFAGLAAIVGSIVSGVLGILFTRFFFEVMLLGFKINEGIQDIRDKAGK